jgi:hypothetical protein
MKTFMRLIRELRAAKNQGFILNFDIKHEFVAHAVFGPQDVDVFAGVPVNNGAKDTYIEVIFDHAVQFESAQRLRQYMISQFPSIDKIVMTYALKNVEMKIYPKDPNDVESHFI